MELCVPAVTSVLPWCSRQLIGLHSGRVADELVQAHSHSLLLLSLALRTKRCTGQRLSAGQRRPVTGACSLAWLRKANFL